METLDRFEQVCRAMADQVFYPHEVSRVERRDTHISAVFLTGDWVYKLKKPMDFGFLNFTTLEARHEFCRREVELNQRLSHGVYEDVVEIRQDEEGAFSLEGSGDAVEYAVKMRQLPDAARLDALLKRKAVGRCEMKALGLHLAGFYEKSGRSGEIDAYGKPGLIELNMEENFKQVEPFVGQWVGREEWEFIRQVSRAFFHNGVGMFERRVASGRVCDGHGDLRAEHIYFHKGIQIIDCIEFNNRFRYGDAVSDLAFLHMDLERLGFSELSREALAAYVHHADDPQLYSLLDFYAAYRAVVKLKVACLRSTEVVDEGERALLKSAVEEYLKQAFRYALQFGRPTLWVFCGLPASGKSTLAAQLAQSLDLPLYQSDFIRKEDRVGEPFKQEIVPYDQGIYRSEHRNRVYGRMLALAQDQLKRGHSVILDGSFARRKWRDEARRLARDLDTNLLFVECRCHEDLIASRLESRDKTTGLSDARLMHLTELIRHFEPLDESTPETSLKVDTQGPLGHVFKGMLSDSYRCKCLQIRNLL